MPGQQMKQNIALGLGLDSSVNFGSANQLQLGWILKTLVWWAGFVWQPRKLETDLKEKGCHGFYHRMVSIFIYWSFESARTPELTDSGLKLKSFLVKKKKWLSNEHRWGIYED